MSGEFNINLHYLFVHMMVHNKHLSFNMHGKNIKVTYGSSVRCLQVEWIYPVQHYSCFLMAFQVTFNPRKSTEV